MADADSLAMNSISIIYCSLDCSSTMEALLGFSSFHSALLRDTVQPGVLKQRVMIFAVTRKVVIPLTSMSPKICIHGKNLLTTSTQLMSLQLTYSR